MPRTPKPRLNLSKGEIEASIKQNLAIEKSKTLARKIFPAIANLNTVYDAQTVLNAVAGFIEYELQKKENDMKVEDLTIDLSKQAESPIKAAVVAVLDIVKMENVREASEMAKLMASKLPSYLAGTHMTDKMETISADKFIA